MTEVQEEFFLGRQPILDRERRIVAYELLFRTGHVGGANVTDDVEASATVITRAFSDFGVETVLGRCKGFINVSRGLLMSDLLELLPRDKVVLELLETVEPDDEVVARCRDLRGMGFALALDDFTGGEDRYAKLLPLVQVVKVDIMVLEPARLVALTTLLKRWPLQLLAEKVDSQEQADHCMALGFKLFQGYFYAKPVVLSGKRFDASKMSLLRLLSLVLNEADIFEIESEFKQSPQLTYSLMRLVNSVAVGLPQRIANMHQAITVLGMRQLQRWVQLLLFAAQGEAALHNPLMLLAASRARFMELLAQKQQPHDRQYQEQAFMAGILSLVDVALGMPLEDIVRELRLAEPVEKALAGREGMLGALLKLAEELEKNRFDAVAHMLDDLPGLGVADLPPAELEATRWAESIGEGV